MSTRDDRPTSDGPHQSPPDLEDPGVWSDLIGAVGPAALLVAIRTRMSAVLLARHTPEDVWQETLLHAWRERDAFEWRGIGAFRRRLLTIIEHRLHDLADHAGAAKRGADRVHIAIGDDANDDSGSAAYAGPVASTTPSRASRDRETAAAMERALGSIPEPCREVVRLRLFEDLTLDEIAAALGIGAATVARRFRKGIEVYHASLCGPLGWKLGDGPMRRGDRCG